MGLPRFPDPRTRSAADEAAGREICTIIQHAVDQGDAIEKELWALLLAGESRREIARDLDLDRSGVQRTAKKVSERLRKRLGLDGDG